jgi:hypothetical protein
LLNRGSAREIQDNLTVATFGYDPENLTIIDNNFLNAYHREPYSFVPLIHLAKVDPDECMRVELLKINTLQVSMLYGMVKIGEYINPAIVKWNGRFLLGCGLAWGTIAGKAANEHLEFHWINISDGHFLSPERYLGISSSVIDAIDTPIVGQDPRFVVINSSRIFVAFTNRFGRLIRMGMAEIMINSSNMASVVNLHHTIIPPGQSYIPPAYLHLFIFAKAIWEGIPRRIGRLSYSMAPFL